MTRTEIRLVNVPGEGVRAVEVPVTDFSPGDAQFHREWQGPIDAQVRPLLQSEAPLNRKTLPPDACLITVWAFGNIVYRATAKRPPHLRRNTVDHARRLLCRISRSSGQPLILAALRLLNGDATALKEFRSCVAASTD